jgi:hypothetical protein
MGRCKKKICCDSYVSRCTFLFLKLFAIFEKTVRRYTAKRKTHDLHYIVSVKHIYEAAKTSLLWVLRSAVYLLTFLLFASFVKTVRKYTATRKTNDN